jgi:superoxide dismutase, Fe-Mn family
MTPMTRRDLLRTAGAATALWTFPGLVRADEAGKAYSLPKLPYAYDALEPHIDAKTMEIHYPRHHQAYVDNLNKALTGTEWAGKRLEELLVQLDKLPEKIRTAVRNNGGGHYNHTLFWEMMSPNATKPSAPLTEAINASFRDLPAMLAQLKEAALTRFGSGWAWVMYQSDGKLKIASTGNQDNPIMDGAGTGILGIDVWEHAYYLKYQNKRADYVDAFFKVINWQFVSEFYDRLKKA